MTRRSALTALTAFLATKFGQVTTTSTWGLAQKGHVQFDLDTFTDYRFRLGERTVTITPKELMDALTHVHTQEPWGDGISMRAGGRPFLLCKDCGQTYWEEKK